MDPTISLILCVATIIDSILILIAIFALISIPGYLKELRADVNRLGKQLEFVDSNLDAIRTQLVEAKKVAIQVRDIQIQKLSGPPAVSTQQ